ncbi:MAG: tripartite tricarboxylate transporter substrate binding protein [Betaproteobacteria bacterium]|nr:tripartite tricarboxylate transporter substrate binding protein [Betaproteobacteria bacterium]MDH3435396.1 tripartite tricarboxylate transporter substrate binding protein [Betaproteobacteria bacterium]
MHIPAIVCGLALIAGLSSVSFAQEFPTKQMRIIVPAGPGGSADFLGRLLADHLHKRLGQIVITENRSGAGQTIGSGYVAKSAPDGHTLVIVTVTYTTSAAIYTRMQFDPLTDLRGVAMVGEGPLVLSVHPSLPVKSVRQLIALAKGKPGQLNYGSAGAGTIPHLATELFAQGANIDIVHVPYKGIAPAVIATVAGEVPMLIASAPSSTPMIKAGRLRALAVTTAKRSPFMPELPTIAEAGVPGYDVATWWGILAPSKTPDAIVKKLNDEIRQILAIDEVKSIIEFNGAKPVLDMSAEEFSQLLKVQIAKWRQIVKERKIKTN